MPKQDSLNPWNAISGSYDQDALVLMALKKRNEVLESQSVRTARRPNDTSATKITKRAPKEKDFVTFNYAMNNDADNQLTRLLLRSKERSGKRTLVVSEAKQKIVEKEQERIEKQERILKQQKEEFEAHLLTIKELHLRKLENEERRRQREEEYKVKLGRAITFHQDLLRRKYFYLLKRNVEIAKSKRDVAEAHYQKRLLWKCMRKLKTHSVTQQQHLLARAKVFHDTSILRRILGAWKQVVADRARQMEVAVDHHNRRLLQQQFQRWRIVAQDAMLVHRAALSTARDHYNRTIMQRAWKMWQEFVSQKSRRLQEFVVRQELRAAVRSVLPDFSPPESDEDDQNIDDEVFEYRYKNEPIDDRYTAKVHEYSMSSTDDLSLSLKNFRLY